MYAAGVKTLRLCLLLLVLTACARAPLKGPENAFRPASTPELSDDLDRASLISAVELSVRRLERPPNTSDLIFGERRVPRAEYIVGLRKLLDLARSIGPDGLFWQAVREQFDFYEVYGQPGWGDVFITSYYEPVIEGSLKRTERFSQPVYRKPADLLTLDLAMFDPKYAEDRKMRARIQDRRIVPYYNREEIDSQAALRAHGLEICYVDPLDSFFLQVQGSATVLLPGGKRIRLMYAEKNGQPYESIGKFVKDAIPVDQLNLHTIEAYLRKLPRAEMQRILNLNPSYVFFQKSEESAVTYFGVPATDGRTIATDRRYFPKGGLAFLSFEKPVFEQPETGIPSKTVRTSRFVVDQDIGGAITGGGRVDLFWGRGSGAKLYAGAMKSPGKLWYLVPKKVP